MKQLIVSCSLSADSHSSLLAEHLRKAVVGVGDQVELIDLRKVDLPFCDAGPCYADPNVIRLKQAVSQASAVTIATPIYNFETGGATRNLIALTGDAWTDKVVGFACAAGGQGSYMAIMSLANSLMLDFRAVIVPRFVYATSAAFNEGRLMDDEVRRRIQELAVQLHRFASALAPPRN